METIDSLKRRISVLEDALKACEYNCKGEIVYDIDNWLRQWFCLTHANHNLLDKLNKDEPGNCSFCKASR